MHIYGIRTYHTYIHIYIDNFLFSPQVWGSLRLAPINIHVWNHYSTVNAVSSSGVVVTRTLERILFLEIGLAVTEINIKKV